MPVLIVTWSYSNAPFAIALPTERTEAVLHGLCEAFAFFAAVPKELWWDNPTTVAIHIGTGRTRTLHSRYAAPRFGRDLLASWIDLIPDRPRVGNAARSATPLFAETRP